MPRYEVVLFDADHTLFDFDRAEREALRQTLEEAGLPADGETEARYLSINRALWNRLDRGEVRREWLVVERFAALLRALGRTGDAAALNRAYLDHLGEGSYLLPGAQALCRALAPRCTLAISRGASRPGWTRLGTIRAGCPATPPSSPPGRWTDTRRSKR